MSNNRAKKILAALAVLFLFCTHISMVPTSACSEKTQQAAQSCCQTAVHSCCGGGQMNSSSGMQISECGCFTVPSIPALPIAFSFPLSPYVLHSSSTFETNVNLFALDDTSQAPYRPPAHERPVQKIYIVMRSLLI